jgi:small subunit ribosomal protein S18
MDPMYELPGGEEENAPEAGRGRGSYIRKPRVCQFCIDKMEHIDYKQVDMLRRYVMERGKIRPRRQTGNCAMHQRALAVAVKRARHLALLPFSGE